MANPSNDNDVQQDLITGPAAADDEITRALAELAELAKPIASDARISLDALYYLLLLWSSFQVYPLEPASERYANGDIKIITSPTGWKIFDYGDCLSISPGEFYGSYSTGKLITVAQEMIEILAQRGITKVGILGHDIAKRAAWITCLEHEINILNYEPSDLDWEIRYRILEERKKAGKIKPHLKPALRQD